jgi:hypothetical protein
MYPWDRQLSSCLRSEIDLLFVLQLLTEFPCFVCWTQTNSVPGFRCGGERRLETFEHPTVVFGGRSVSRIISYGNTTTTTHIDHRAWWESGCRTSNYGSEKNSRHCADSKKPWPSLPLPVRSTMQNQGATSTLQTSAHHKAKNSSS